MSFKEAVENTKGLEQAYQPGLQALKRSDRKEHISCREPRMVTGSVDLDSALATMRPNDPRWDYGVGVASKTRSESVVWIEIHPASSNHVKDVLAKLDWLKNWLRMHAPQLDKMAGKFYWVASGQVYIRRGSQQQIELAQKGLQFPRKHLQIS